LKWLVIRDFRFPGRLPPIYQNDPLPFLPIILYRSAPYRSP
jgi:hypothetical protein